MLEELKESIGEGLAFAGEIRRAGASGKTCGLTPPLWWEKDDYPDELICRGVYFGLPFAAYRTSLSVVTVNTQDTYRAKNRFRGIRIVCLPGTEFPADVRAWEKTGTESISKEQRKQLFRTNDADTDRAWYVQSEDPEHAAAMLTPAYFELLSALHRIPGTNASFGAVDGRFHMMLNNKRLYRRFLTGTNLSPLRTANSYRKVYRDSEELLKEWVHAAAAYRDSVQNS